MSTCGEPLTETEVSALPEGTPVVVIWSGGNGPHRYWIAVRHGQRYAAARPDEENERMRYYNPLRSVGVNRWQTRVWRTEPGDSETGGSQP